MQDQEWIKQIQMGDHAAFAQLYQRYARDVYQYIYLYMNHRQTTEDLVQETFLRAYKNSYQYDLNKSAIRTWLHRIAAHLCIDNIRKKKPNEVTLEIYYEPKLAGIADKVENQIWIKKFLTRLPDLNRSILILAYYQGFKGKEIAEIVGIPVGTVKSKLHYSLQKLKTWMNEEGESYVS
ncbi:RNA polymerase sigma factor [Risungbinella massiliensis]|uniref:RNA polymerase sigma factor n=1 Tax=Risungbinella massiliensis TaxID=1329796 RepID=UPI0005CC2022|nr:RNA polymerase sigma factor [Risungbinella massiliensis]